MCHQVVGHQVEELGHISSPNAAKASLTISTFSSDIARAVSRYACGSSATASTHSQINGRDSLCR